MISPITSTEQAMTSPEKGFLSPHSLRRTLPLDVSKIPLVPTNSPLSMIPTLRFPLVTLRQPLAQHVHLDSGAATAHARLRWSRPTSDRILPCGFHPSTQPSPTTDFSAFPAGLAPQSSTWTPGLGLGCFFPAVMAYLRANSFTL